MPYKCLFVVSSGLIPDKEVRVSVKALAVSCVGAAAALHPEAFFNSLYLEPLDGVPVAGVTANSVVKTLLIVFGLKNYNLLKNVGCRPNPIIGEYM